MAIKETASGENSVAITGIADGNGSRGVLGRSDHGGVKGEGDRGSGVLGISKQWMGVHGYSDSTTGGAGVWGEAIGIGVVGKSKTWAGVYGETASTTGGPAVWGEHKANGTGVFGKTTGGVGVWGVSETHEGVHAECKSPGAAALAAFNLNPAGTGAAVYARKEGAQGHAGFFEGRVWISAELAVGGDILLANADCAEDFDVVSHALAEPGSVMVLGEDGVLYPCGSAYDKRVAGVVSGAGAYRPGMILDRRNSDTNRRPVALLGKVFCKATTLNGPIEIGDLLTTSPIEGRAMKASDPAQAFGAVIGKAMCGLPKGEGLVPILISLQ